MIENKEDFEVFVNRALDRMSNDYHTFTKIMLFCNYLWQVMSEGNENEKNKRDINTSSN